MDYQERTRKDKERTRKGQGKDEKRTKGRKKDKGFIFILHVSKRIKKTIKV